MKNSLRLRFIFFTLVFPGIFSAAGYAQPERNTDLDKGRQRPPAAKPVVKKNPPIVKKAEPKPVPKPPEKKPVLPANKPKDPPRTGQQKKKKQGKSTGRYVRVNFTVPENGLEVEVDKKGFFVNRDREVQISLTPGVHVVFVKRNGQRITDGISVNIDRSNPSIDLGYYIREDSGEEAEKKVMAIGPAQKPEPKEAPRAEATQSAGPELNRVSANSAAIAIKMRNIIERFGDPLYSDKVSLSDWNYVYQQSTQNETLDTMPKDMLTLISYLAAGQISVLQDKPAAAIISLEKAVTYALNMKGAAKSSPIPHYALGNAYFATKDYTRAQKQYEAAINIDPKFAMAYSKMGDLLKATGKSRDALRFFLEAYNNGYKTYPTALSLASGLRMASNYDEAINVFKNMLQNFPPSAEVYSGLGDCYMGKKEVIRAIDSYREATKIDPKHSPSYFKLGDIFRDYKDYSLAIDSWRKALEADPMGKMVSKYQIEARIKDARKKLD